MEKKRNVRVLYIYLALAVVVVITTVFMQLRLQNLGDGIKSMQDITEEYITSQQAVHSMREASDLLTAEARLYVMTGDTEHLDAYFKEVNIDKRRDNALETLQQYQEENEAYQALTSAVEHSNALAEVEMYAMYMASETYGMSEDIRQKNFEGITLTEEDEGLSIEEKKEKSAVMMFDKNYQEMKNEILDTSYGSLDRLIENTRDRQISSYDSAAVRLRRLNLMFMIVVIVVILAMLVTAVLIIWPLTNSVHLIKDSKPLPEKGAAEYVYLAHTYNNMLEMTRAHQEQLSFDATHDELTGLYNRKVFEERRGEHIDNGIAMLLIDVDYFKSINDTYGHEMGDKVLKRIADILAASFRNEDYVCRIGGDEFAVIMLHMNPSLKHIVKLKIDTVREKIAEQKDLPKMTLSIGVALSVEGDKQDVFKKADSALYDVKEKGRNGYGFYKG